MPGPNVDRAVADLQVVGDVALRPVGDELGQADLVLVGEPGQVAVVGDARRHRVDPLEAQVAHHRTSLAVANGS